MSNSSTIQAGATKADDAIVCDNAPLTDLLAPRTVSEADAALQLIASRREAAQAASERHATARDDALIAGAEVDHDAQAQRLADDARRLAVAAERITARRDQLAAADRLDAARGSRDAGRKAAAQAEKLTMEYTELGRQLVDVLAELPALYREIEIGRHAAQEHGLDTDGLALPHESRSRSAEFEDVAVEVVQRDPCVTDAAGRSLDLTPANPPSRFTRIDNRMIRPPVQAPDLTTARIVLPDPNGGVPILNQGSDR